MTTHSSVLAWRVPGTQEPGILPSMGSHRVGHNWSDLAAAADAIEGDSLRLSQCLCWELCTLFLFNKSSLNTPIPSSVDTLENTKLTQSKVLSAPVATDRAETLPRGATPHRRSGVAIESARLRWPRSGLEELPAPKVRGGGPEEQHPPHPAPSKEQQLRSCRGA